MGDRCRAYDMGRVSLLGALWDAMRCADDVDEDEGPGDALPGEIMRYSLLRSGSWRTVRALVGDPRSSGGGEGELDDKDGDKGRGGIEPV